MAVKVSMSPMPPRCAAAMAPRERLADFRFDDVLLRAVLLRAAAMRAPPLRNRASISCIYGITQRAARRPAGPVSGPAESLAQRVLGFFQPLPVGLVEIFAGAIDVEHEHRHRRAERIGLAPLARLGRALERCG